MTPLAVIRTTIATMSLVAVIGCGSTPVATNRPAASNPGGSAPPVVVTPRPPSTAEGLCDVFTADLALAALGVPVAQPTGGDVVPRPNGIYCHYAAADDANTTVEAQLKDMTRAEFDALATELEVTTPLPGIGEVAFRRDGSIMGVAGVSVIAWAGGRGVTVIVNRAGDDAQLLAAASAIAAKVLLASA